MSGTSWLLGAGYAWPAARALASPGAAGAVSDPELGLSLRAVAGGPLGLGSSDGSLGRLTLPLGVAVARGRVFVLSTAGDRVYVWDTRRQCLRPMPHVGAWGGRHAANAATPAREARRFTGAANIAARERLLYVADPAAHRVQVFDWTTGVLVRLHTGLSGPTDVAAGTDGVYVLDGPRGRVYLAAPGAAELTLVADVPECRGAWTRIAVDCDDRVYLRRLEPASPPGVPPVVVLDAIALERGRVACWATECVDDAGAVRSRFAPPRVWSTRAASASAWRFAIDAALLDPCGIRSPLTGEQRAYRVGGVRWILDRKRRVLEARDSGGGIRHRFGPLGADGEPTTASAADAWSPADLAMHGACTLVLDDANQIVYAFEPGSPLLRRWFAGASSGWHRLAVDVDDALLLWDGASTDIDRLDTRGRTLGTCAYRDVRAAFERRAEDRTTFPPAADVRVDRDGRVTLASDDPMPDLRRVYERSGTWVSDWLDSDIYQCQWHRLELAIAELPPGSRIALRTRTTNDRPMPVGDAMPLDTLALAGSWSDPLTIVAPVQPTPEELAAARTRDLLVQSGPGQYLQLLVELSGDGLATPVVRSVRLTYPYDSLRQFLPAVYSRPEEQRQFVDRLLGVVQRTWDDIERTVTGFDRYLDPDSVPPDAMRWLASWLGIRLEGTWSAEQNRALFAATRDTLARWGTPAAVREWLAVYLANLSGLDAATLAGAGVPALVEGFVERRRLMLGRDSTARLGGGEPLWGPRVERRLQLGVFDREGEVELVSLGDPQLDFFQHSAHRFRVYVPSAWVRTADDEALLRRAIDAIAPAHVSWELVLVEARFRVGVQSTIGLDAIVAAPRAGVLRCPSDGEPASRPPHDRLGFDLTLDGASDPAALGGRVLILA